MNYPENPSEAAELLRQAVPLMVRHQIAPNPLNYALWYTYVSNRLPALNQALDATLRTYGTCPSEIGEQLVKQHLYPTDSASTRQIQDNLINLVTTLSEQANAAAQHTGHYSEQLRDSLDALMRHGNAAQEALPLESVLRTLALNTESINEKTLCFQQQIDAAQQEIDSLKNALEQARQDAQIDALTGLGNRRLFDTELQRLVQSDAAAALTLIMLDVDHFKQFNDRYGHQTGDRVLQYVGALLREECQAPVLAARFGGEEFALLLPGAEPQQTLAFAERLRQRVAAIRLRQKSSGSVISTITASFGVATRGPAESAGSLIERADQALYQAKQQGRNRVCSAADRSTDVQAAG